MSEPQSTVADDLNQATASLVRGVDLAHVNLTVLNTALKEAGLKVTAKTTVEERVIAMADHDAKAIGGEKEKGGSCDKCGGISLLSRPSCPYCGTGDEQPMPDAPAAKPAPRSRKEAAAAKAAKPIKASKSKPEPAKVDPPQKPDKPKPLAKTSGTAAITPANVKELEGVTRRLKGLVSDTMTSHWKLGRELISAMKSGVYKYRIGPDKLPVHANFGAYCSTELGLSSQYSRSLMAVAETFTEKQVREIGVTKLKFIARVPEEVRGELLEKAANLPSREIERQVQEIAPDGARAPIERDDVKARPHLRDVNAKQNKAKPTRAVAPNEATAIIVPQRVELPMWARAKSAETQEQVRAKTLGANPFCIYDLQNGMQLHIKWVEDDDGLVSVVEFKRVDDTVEAEGEAAPE